MEDFELTLFDRISLIRDLNDKYDLLSNSYIAFSGGKDSTVLHYLVDLALPNNHIPRVYSDTGFEYGLVRDFVKSFCSVDERFVILPPDKNIVNTLRDIGYPFKSKEHSQYVNLYQDYGFIPKVSEYYDYLCLPLLKYQFRFDFNIKISKKCCSVFKKDKFSNYEIENKRSIVLTGLRIAEGGIRKNIKCILTDKEGNVSKIHFLRPLTDDFIQWFINKYNIQLCKLYYPPFNFKRTGCRGCPYNPDLQTDLMVLKELLPNEYKSACYIWKPIYDEYIRIKYRLKHY